MPPLVLVHGEALGFHDVAQEIAMPALEGSAAGIVRKRARRHLIVRTNHFDGLAGREFVEGEIDGAAAIVARALRGIGDEDVAFGRSGFPENFCDVPRTIGIVDQKAISPSAQGAVGAKKSFGGAPLEKCPGLRVDGCAEEVVAGGVANVEANRGVERGKVHQIRGTKVAGFVRRRSSEGFLAQLFDGADGGDLKNVAFLVIRDREAVNGADAAALERTRAKGEARGFTRPGALKSYGQDAGIGEIELERVSGTLAERPFAAVFAKDSEPAALLEDVVDIVVGAVFANETSPGVGNIGRLGGCWGRRVLRRRGGAGAE